MLRRQRTGAGIHSASRLIAGGAIVVSAAVLGGCSTDFTRLEQPTYTLAEKSAPRPSEPMGRANAGGPIGAETWPDSGPRGPLPPVTADQRPVATPLPPPVAGGIGPSRPFDAPKKSAAAVPAPPTKPLSVASGRTIDVQQGDTLYAISKRTGYPVSALMEVNGLKNPNLKPGQKLSLPAGPTTRKPLARATAPVTGPAPMAAAPSSALPPIPPAATAPYAPPHATPPASHTPPTVSTSGWTGTHTVKPGEVLYGIARHYKIPVAVLQQQNGITDPTKVRPGTALKVPGVAGETPVAAAPAPLAPPPVVPRVAPVPTPAPAPVEATPATPAAPGMPQPKIINGADQKAPEKQVAALGGTASDATAAAPVDPPVTQAPTKPTVTITPAAGSKFRWPARGSVLSGFGKRPDGTHNDGVNISVPLGSDVVAADSGTVAYAGNELKGYGNLVLIRHDNGWVSAYAHADQLLVKRGDTIKRGQVIAKAGKTGTVDQPQVHFELRQGSKPVDPLPHMEKQL